MKILLLLVALAGAALPPLAAAPPALPIDQALKLAMEHLAERGLAGRHSIESLSLETSTLVGGTKFWFARWMPSIPVEQKSESGCASISTEASSA